MWNSVMSFFIGFLFHSWKYYIYMIFRNYWNKAAASEIFSIIPFCFSVYYPEKDNILIYLTKHRKFLPWTMWRYITKLRFGQTLTNRLMKPGDILWCSDCYRGSRQWKTHCPTIFISVSSLKFLDQLADHTFGNVLKLNFLTWIINLVF